MRTRTGSPIRASTLVRSLPPSNASVEIHSRVLRATTASITAPPSKAPSSAADRAAHDLRDGAERDDGRRHQHHRVGDPHHLLDRVAHVDDGHLQLVAHQLDVVQDLVLAVGVERGERLVEQQQARARQQRAADRDALLLAAGQVRRPPIEQARKSEQRDDVARAEPRSAGRGKEPRVAAGSAARSGAGTEPPFLEHVADAPRVGGTSMPCRVEQRLAVDGDAAALRAQDPAMALTTEVLPGTRAPEERRDAVAGLRTRRRGGRRRAGARSSTDSIFAGSPGARRAAHQDSETRQRAERQQHRR